MKRLIFISFLILSALKVEAAYVWNTWTYSETSPTDGTLREVRLAIPSDFNIVRGLLINYNASGGTASTMDQYTIKAFQNFMRLPEHQFAFIGTHGFEQAPQAQYTTPVMLRALANLAAQSGHPEVTNAPWAMYAFSAGASRSWEATSTNSSIVLGWNGISGGFGFFGNPPLLNALDVPAYINASKIDAGQITNSNYRIVATNVPLGWLASFSLIQNGTGHAETWHQYVPGMTLLRSAIRVGYPTNQCVLNGKLSLNRLAKSDGWLVKPNFNNVPFPYVTNYAAYTFDKTNDAWFVPDKDMAYVYRAYASWDNQLAITAPLSETEVAPGGNITVTINDSAFTGWTNLALFNFATNIANKTSGTASFTITNIPSGMYVLHVIGTKSGTNAISQPILFYANVTSPPPVLPCPTTHFWYAATNGLPGNAGTLASPWDLWTAGHKTNTIVGGDFLFLRGGAYTNTVRNYITNISTGSIFEFLLNGSYNNYVTIMPYNNEYVIIDGQQSPSQYRQHNTDDSPSARPTVKIGDANNANCGRWLNFQDLEIMSSSLEARYANILLDSAFPDDIFRHDGVYVYGRSNIIANCRVHDLNSGILTWGGSGGTVVYGNILYNNGWQSAHRHGHNQYSQNFTNSPTKFMMTNFMFNAADKNYQYYGSSDSFVAHYRIGGNVSVNADTLEGGRTSVIIYDHVNTNNFYYNSDLVFMYDYGTNYGDILIANNYIVGGRMQGGAWQTAIITNNITVNTTGGDIFDLITQPVGNVLPWTVNRNTFYASSAGGNYFRQEGFAPINLTNWRINTGYEVNSTMITPLPVTNYVIVQKNVYNPDRGHVIIYNFANNNTVNVDLSTPLGWSSSQAVLVRNMQDYYVDTTVGVLSGGILAFDMQAPSHSLAIPRGTNVAAWGPKTYPAFGEFVVEKTTPSGTNTLDVTSSSPTTVTLSPNDLNGLSGGATPFTRLYIDDTVLNLNADGVIQDKTFQKWTKNGSDYSTAQNIVLPLDTSFTMSAIYTNNATNTITITSSPSGVIVTNSPADQLGVTQGATSRTIKYFYNTTVTLTAPSTFQTTNAFFKWTKNGIDFSGVSAIALNATANDTYNAVYVPVTTNVGTNNAFLISRRRPF